MKRALTLLAMLALVSSAAWASVPDPDYCTVSPMDEMASPRLVGIPADPALSASYLDITIAAFGGEPIDDAFVEVVISGLCDGLCICDVANLTGNTDPTGFVRIRGQFGGCCDLSPDMAVIIVAEGVGIRSAMYAVSPDYNGAEADCAVTLADFVYFGTEWGLGSGVVCADYSGDEACSLADFVIFGAGWGNTCTPEP